MNDTHDDRLAAVLHQIDPEGAEVGRVFERRLAAVADTIPEPARAHALRRAKQIPQAVRITALSAGRARVVHKALFDPRAGGTPAAPGGVQGLLAETLGASTREVVGERWDAALDEDLDAVCEVVVRFVFAGLEREPAAS